MRRRYNDMEIRSKLWIEVNGEPIFGKGRSCLLNAIDRHGSINRAAKEVNITYRKAWSYLDTMESRLGVKLVERKTGGRNGGGAILTDTARQLIRNYEQMEREVTALANRRFSGIFGTKADGRAV
jgi:molybdate transport system regulatory protein